MLWHLLIVHFRKLAKFRYKFGCRLRLKLPLKKLTWLCARLDWAYCTSTFWVSRFHFFFLAHVNSDDAVHAHGFTVHETKCTVHRTYNHFIQKKNILKLAPTELFTHLKINITTCLFGFDLLRVCVLSFTFPFYFFFFFFFFSERMNSNGTVHAHGFTVQETKCTVHRTYNPFILKKIY